MSKVGYKKFPHNWRARVFKELKGIRLSVWMYHWSRSGPDDTVETSLDQLTADLPYAKSRIVKARGELKRAGWLVAEQETYKDEFGRWIVPTFKAVIPEETTIFPVAPKRVARNPVARKALADRSALPANGKGATTVDTLSVDTGVSDPSGLRVNTLSVSQPASEAPSALASSAEQFTEDERGLAIFVTDHFCRIANLEWNPSYTEQFLPLTRKIPEDILVTLVKGQTIRKQFWMRDLSTVRQLIWRLESTGEDSLVTQLRQEQNIDRELLRAEIKKKLKKKQGLNYEEWDFSLADSYAVWGWRKSTLFSDPFIFRPLTDRGVTAEELYDAINRAVGNDYGWAVENLSTPEDVVANWDQIANATPRARIAVDATDEEEGVLVKNIRVDEP